MNYDPSAILQKISQCQSSLTAAAVQNAQINASLRGIAAALFIRHRRFEVEREPCGLMLITFNDAEGETLLFDWFLEQRATITTKSKHIWQVHCDEKLAVLAKLTWGGAA